MLTTIIKMAIGALMLSPPERVEFTAPLWCNQYFVYHRSSGFNAADIEAMDKFLSDNRYTVTGFKDGSRAMESNDFSPEYCDACITYTANKH